MLAQHAMQAHQKLLGPQGAYAESQVGGRPLSSHSKPSPKHGWPSSPKPLGQGIGSTRVTIAHDGYFAKVASRRSASPGLCIYKGTALVHVYSRVIFFKATQRKPASSYPRSYGEAVFP